MEPSRDLNHFIMSLYASDTDSQQQAVSQVYAQNATLRTPWLLAIGKEEIAAHYRVCFGKSLNRSVRVHNATFDSNTRKIYVHYSLYLQPEVPLISSLSSHTISNVIQGGLNVSSFLYPPQTIMEKVPTDTLDVSRTIVIEVMSLCDLEPTIVTGQYAIVCQNDYWLNSPLLPFAVNQFVDVLDILWVRPWVALTKTLGGQQMAEFLKDHFKVVDSVYNWSGISSKTNDSRYPYTVTLANLVKRNVARGLWIIDRWIA